MSILTVRKACKVSELVSNDSLVDQIANLEDREKRRIDPDAFFRRNDFTDGLRTLVYNRFERLSARSDFVWGHIATAAELAPILDKVV